MLVYKWWDIYNNDSLDYKKSVGDLERGTGQVCDRTIRCLNVIVIQKFGEVDSGFVQTHAASGFRCFQKYQCNVDCMFPKLKFK